MNWALLRNSIVWIVNDDLEAAKAEALKVIKEFLAEE